MTTKQQARTANQWTRLYTKPRDITIRLRVTCEERIKLHEAAIKAGVTLSQYIRSKVL